MLRAQCGVGDPDTPGSSLLYLANSESKLRRRLVERVSGVNTMTEWRHILHSWLNLAACVVIVDKEALRTPSCDAVGALEW